MLKLIIAKKKYSSWLLRPWIAMRVFSSLGLVNTQKYNFATFGPLIFYLIDDCDLLSLFEIPLTQLEQS